jgi:plastocyanin
MNRLFILSIAFVALGAGCLSKPVLDMTPPTAETTEVVQQATTTISAPVETATTTIAPTEPTPTTATKPKPTTTAPKPSLQPNSPTPTTGAIKVYISILDTGFSPQVTAVNKGDTVVWTNNGTSNHTVESTGSNIYHSGNIPPGTSWARVFSAPGSYNYHDGAHPSFTGTVSVR